MARLHCLILSIALVSLPSCSSPDSRLEPTANDPPTIGPFFPSEDESWETVSLEETGWDSLGVESALSYAADHHSSAVLIIHQGRIALERYWQLPDSQPFRSATYGGVGLFEYDDLRRPVEDVMSVQKSAISFLAAVARDRGMLQIDEPVSEYLGEGWSATPNESEGQVLVRHLLSMSSGLTTALELDSGAGSKWFYNTNAYSVLLRVLESATGMTADEYTREWLTEPAGMTQSGWRVRPWVTPDMDANRVGFATTARDLGRFGILISAQGTWDGEALLEDAAYLNESFQPSQALNPSYGFLWWLNGQNGWEDWDHQGTVAGMFIPTAPADLVAARGVGDRRLYVVPSLELVVVRLGAPALMRPDGSADLNVFDREFWRLLMAAAPS